jgi:hypothetical protein
LRLCTMSKRCQEQACCARDRSKAAGQKLAYWCCWEGNVVIWTPGMNSAGFRIWLLQVKFTEFCLSSLLSYLPQSTPTVTSAPCHGKFCYGESPEWSFRTIFCC